jgi:hypothetical protein
VISGDWGGQSPEETLGLFQGPIRRIIYRPFLLKLTERQLLVMQMFNKSLKNYESDTCVDSCPEENGASYEGT